MTKKSLNESESLLLQNFQCIKCRNRQAHCRTVKFTYDAKNWLPFASNELIMLTCTLCGFSEFYDPAVSASEKYPEADETSPLPTES